VHGSCENFPKGWYVDVAQHDPGYHTFMAGIRAGSQGPVRGFGHFLLGGARFGASNDTHSA